MQLHKYHLVKQSPWPLTTSIAIFTLMIGLVLKMHNYKLADQTMILGLVLLLSNMFIWWKDITDEIHNHTPKVVQGFKIGMGLFIISEIMFFAAFFWAYFHASLAPTIEIGAVWPPKGLNIISPFGIPLLNTVILLTSGAFLTTAHLYFLESKKQVEIVKLRWFVDFIEEILNDIKYDTFDTELELYAAEEENVKLIRYAFVMTIILAIIFTCLQFNEYKTADFAINSGVYGSTFFMLTGFHGLHVIIGTIFIIVSFVRWESFSFSKKSHFGLEASIWYWHFVDVIWLIVFIAVYFWPTI